MDSIIISLIPSIGLLLLGAALWFTDPEVRKHRALARSRSCVGCGKSHNRRNACDKTFSAFCTNACHTATQG